MRLDNRIAPGSAPWNRAAPGGGSWKKSGKSGLGGYGHTIGGRIFITLFPAHAGMIPTSISRPSPASYRPCRCPRSRWRGRWLERQAPSRHSPIEGRRRPFSYPVAAASPVSPTAAWSPAMLPQSYPGFSSVFVALSPGWIQCAWLCVVMHENAMRGTN